MKAAMTGLVRYIVLASFGSALTNVVAQNEIGRTIELATSSSVDMPTANNDTLYVIAYVAFKGEPYVISVPDTYDRYTVWGIGSDGEEHEAWAGTNVLVPPGWSGTIPSGCGGSKCLGLACAPHPPFVGRVAAKEITIMPGEPLGPVELRKQFKLTPLSAYKPYAGDDEPAFRQYSFFALKYVRHTDADGER